MLYPNWRFHCAASLVQHSGYNLAVPHRLPDSFLPSSDALSKRLGNEVVLVHLRTDRIYSLNATAARFWELLQQDHDRDEITRRLLHEFDVSHDELDAEITRLLTDLLALDLIAPEDDD